MLSPRGEVAQQIPDNPGDDHKANPRCIFTRFGSAAEVRIQRSWNLALIHVNAVAAGADSPARSRAQEGRMRARDVMVRAVATTTPETTVEELARLMINLRISGGRLDGPQPGNSMVR